MVTDVLGLTPGVPYPDLKVHLVHRDSVADAEATAVTSRGSPPWQ
jgi:hypothetical protein